VREAENSIQLVVDLIHPLSRSVITNYRATFVGAERYHRTVHNITERIDAALPLRAQIIAREEDRVLINAGSIHGIAPEEELVVIEQGALTPSESSLAFRYPDISEVGTIVITEVDDRVAEGEVMRKEIFDTFTIGDEVFMHSRALPQPSPRDTPSPLYDYILQIR